MLKIFLWPLAALYWLGLHLNQCWRGWRARSLPKPVISVGNLTVGGTGKTPLLIYLSERLLAQSKKTAVLTRGYRQLSDAAASGGNDETLLLKKRCPGVLVAPDANRWRAAQTLLLNTDVDVFLIDDGFQHVQLKRDLDLVCIDATNPWGGGHLLPAGRLREPKRALVRAGGVVVNRSELVSTSALSTLIKEIDTIASGLPVFVSRTAYRLVSCATGQPLALETFNGGTVVALSAIGNPSAFESTLTQWASSVVSMRYRDHHEFSQDDVRRVLDRARGASASVVMTEKDWVKIERLPVDKAGMYILEMSLEFATEQKAQFDVLIRSALR